MAACHIRGESRSSHWPGEAIVRLVSPLSCSRMPLPAGAGAEQPAVEQEVRQDRTAVVLRRNPVHHEQHPGTELRVGLLPDLRGPRILSVLQAAAGYLPSVPVGGLDDQDCPVRVAEDRPGVGDVFRKGRVVLRRWQAGR